MTIAITLKSDDHKQSEVLVKNKFSFFISFCTLYQRFLWYNETPSYN